MLSNSIGMLWMWQQNTPTKTIASTRVFLFHSIDVAETRVCLLHNHDRDKASQ